MHLIKLPELRLSDLQNLFEKCIHICKNLKDLDAAIHNISNILTTLNDVTSNENPSIYDKKTQDKNRDTSIAGLFNQVAVEKAFPENSPQVKDQLTQLSLILNNNRWLDLRQKIKLHNSKHQALTQTTPKLSVT